MITQPTRYSAMKRNQVTLTVPNDYIYLPMILNMVRNMADIMGFDQESINQLELGAEEAVSNVIKYAFEGSGDANFQIILEPVTVGLNIFIREKGVPFDPSLMHQYSIATLRTDLNEKGLGTYLMKQLFDAVSFHNLGKEGKETRLFKHTNNKQIHELITEEELSIVESEKSTSPLPRGSVHYLIRRMKPAEAIEVSKCAYSSYGYTYVNEDIYYPDRVRTLNQSDNLISFIAVTEQNEIIAHNAFELRKGDLAPELGMAFTKPKFRGQGCLNHLTMELLNEAGRRNFVGIYTRGVMTHPFSQKSFLKFGFRESAIYLSSGMERTYKGGIKQDKSQRESVVIMFKYLSTPKKHVIYPPPHHREMIERIYHHLDVNPNSNASSKESDTAADETVTGIRIAPACLMGHISITRYGDRTLNDVKEHLKALCLQRFETIHLHLPLGDPSTAFRTAEFEKLGFFFAGVMPGCIGNDELILQYLNNYAIDYDTLVIESEMGKEMLEYIRRHNQIVKPD